MRLGLVWRGHDPDACDDPDVLEKIRERTEADHTIIGHTSLDNGTHVANWEWDTSEIRGTEVDELARAAWKLDDDLPELRDSTLAQLDRAGLVDLASAV